MQVILTEDVVGLGDIGQTVNVKPGFARNYLIPRGIAFEVNARSAREVEHRMRQVNAKKDKLKGDAEQRAESLSKVVIELGLRVGTGGKVFGSVSTRDIASKLRELDYEVDRRRVLLSEPIKQVGEHEVEIKLHADVRAKVKVVVLPLSSSKEDEEAEAFEAKLKLEAEKARRRELEELGIEVDDGDTEETA